MMMIGKVNINVYTKTNPKKNRILSNAYKNNHQHKGHISRAVTNEIALGTISQDRQASQRDTFEDATRKTVSLFSFWITATEK